MVCLFEVVCQLRNIKKIRDETVMVIALAYVTAISKLVKQHRDNETTRPGIQLRYSGDVVMCMTYLYAELGRLKSAIPRLLQSLALMSSDFEASSHTREVWNLRCSLQTSRSLAQPLRPAREPVFPRAESAFALKILHLEKLVCLVVQI